MRTEDKIMDYLNEDENTILKNLFKDVHRKMTGRVTGKDHIKQIAQITLKDAQTLLGIFAKPNYDSNSEQAKKTMIDLLKDVNKALILIKNI